MKPTRYANFNYKHLKPLIDGMSFDDNCRHYESSGFMPLTVELLFKDDKGRWIYSLTHYGEQNGDLMADPTWSLRLTTRPEPWSR